MTRATMEERAAYRVEVTQADIDSFHVYVADPTGRSFAQWWVFPVYAETWVRDRLTREARLHRYAVRYELCSRPGTDQDGKRYVIRDFPDYDKATRQAMLRARTWLGSKWGLRTPARKLP